MVLILFQLNILLRKYKNFTSQVTMILLFTITKLGFDKAPYLFLKLQLNIKKRFVNLLNV